MMDLLFTKFCVLQGAFWAFQATLPSFISAYILYHGMPAATLGILLAVYLLCAFAGSMFWGHWVDRRQANRRFFLIGNAAVLVLGLLVFTVAGQCNVPALFVALPAFGFMNGPLGTILDAWVIATFPQNPNTCPRSRSYATLLYALVMLCMGLLIPRLGYWVLPAAGLIFLGISIMTAFSLPECRQSTDSPAAGAVNADPRNLLKSHTYVLLVGVIFFTGMAIAPINNMKLLVFKSVGGDVSFLGWDSFIGCMIQLPFLRYAAAMRHIPAQRRLLFGTLAAMMYAFMVVIATNPAMVIMGTVMANVSFGFLYTSMREITEASVDPSLRNTAHSIIDAVNGSLSGMVAAAWSGAAMQYAGRTAMGSICILLQMVGIVLCFRFLALYGGGKRQTRHHRRMAHTVGL